MPSEVYKPSSAWKVVMAKLRWSFSLAKLMHSCSKEFVWKISNPKISRTPMKRPMVSPSALISPVRLLHALTRRTIQSKRPAYSAATKASRFFSAAFADMRLLRSSRAVFTRYEIIPLTSAWRSAPRSHAA